MKRSIKMLSLFFALVFWGQESKACTCSNSSLTIDSLAQLKGYSFIAHVRVTNEEDFKKPSEKDYRTIGLLTFEIIELFKGERLSRVLEYSKNTSCDIGISVGEEWVLFGKTINGQTSIIDCDRNQQYRDGNGLRDWKYGNGFYELKQLRKIFKHPADTFDNIKRQEFYKNGKIEIEENYHNGKLNGERKIWYPNGVLFCKQFYINDTLDRKSEWFYPSGQIYDEDYYIMGKHCNVSRLYYDSTIDNRWKKMLIKDFYKTEDSLKFVYNRIQPRYETVYDSYGRVLISREYTQIGKISSETTTIDPDRKFKVVVYYHDNGTVSSILYSLNEIKYGHCQSYDKNGFPDRAWDFNEKGQAIKRK